MKFRDGIQINSSRDAYSLPDRLEEPTEANLQTVRNEILVGKVIPRLDNIFRNPQLLSVAQWKRINSIIDEEPKNPK